MADLTQQLEGYRLTTAQIFYHMPDYEQILQEFVWQDYDLAPKFPHLFKFLNFWEREIEGALHSVYVADTAIITTSDYRNADWLGTVQ